MDIDNSSPPGAQPVRESQLVLHHVMRMNAINTTLLSLSMASLDASVPRDASFYKHDLDLLKTSEPPANLMSVQHVKIANGRPYV
jgi:hypothetical protein